MERNNNDNLVHDGARRRRRRVACVGRSGLQRVKAWALASLTETESEKGKWRPPPPILFPPTFRFPNPPLLEYFPRQCVHRLAGLHASAVACR